MGKNTALLFLFPIPHNAHKSINILIGGSVELDHRDIKAQNGMVPSSLEELLGVLAERRPGRGLYARSYMKSGGLRIATEVLSSLPLSQRTILGADTRASRVATSETLGEAVHINWKNVVLGQLPLTIGISN